MNKFIIPLIMSIGLMGCFGTVPICNPMIIHDKTSTVVHDKIPVVIVQPLLPYPDEPCHHLEELTKGLEGPQKLAVILAADKACINNLETTLKLTGRVKEQ
jgi:hypothetical protein